MGLFAHWICAKDGGDALRDAGFGEIVEAETPGWVIGQPESGAQLPEWEELDETVARVAAAAGGSALGSWIYDSDVGYLVAADGDGTLCRLVVNPEAADAYDFPFPEGWPDGAIASFAEWSEGAPNSLDARAIAEVVGRDWSVAEEGVQDLPLACLSNFASEQDAQEVATRWHAPGEWREVPEDVPGNLLETVWWVLAQ
jgi:hypothetical protein